ncbi:hypothetical protein Aph02nite_66660 [Actinoplanes philippinensis]|uniref:histidine kinase n=1 Tax=Actinoplanes philippinensis TaxID=35752 RepID=A0A1I2L0K9_9ACTN|nr:PAS domain S-box protein [Actinoplanes philippinensis]GIE80716.1 hypothetical protein Aph02nite_66660 [Actinoplanes philippinensis]SFF72363.1 PAS domain S-box-containing protein [Actinoplanes philippinensis]
MVSPSSGPAPLIAARELQEPARLRALRATGLLEQPSSAVLERLTRLAGRLVNAPVALVSLVTDDRQVFPCAVGLPEPWASRAETPLSHSFCRHVVMADAPLIVTDARGDDRVSDNLAIDDIGVVAYAGFPLRSPQGHTLGSFCVIDNRPRVWSPSELAVVEDLAAAAEAEIAMRLSQAELMSESRRRQAILNAAADAFVTADENGLVHSWNVAAEQLFGWSECEALGRPMSELMIPERFRERHEAGLRRVRAEGRSRLAGQRLDMTALDRAGREFPVEMVLQAQVGDDGTFFHAFLHDISDRKAREQEISDSEARFRSLFESSPIGMALVGLDGAWLRVNPAMSVITGHTADELLAIDFQTITHPDDLDQDLGLVEQLLAGEISDYRMHKRYLRKDGTTVWCLLSVALVRDDTGAPQHFLSQIVEVDAERRSRELLDVTFAAAPDPHLLATPDGVALRVNAAWGTVLGWTEGDLLGADVTAMVHPHDQAEVRGFLRAAASGRQTEQAVTVVSRYRTASGTYRWLQWHGAAAPGQGLVVATARDVTEARAVQEALRRSEEQSRMAFEASPLGMVIADSDGRFVRLNPAFAQLLGTGDLVGRDYREVTHPDDRESSAHAVARMLRDGVGELEKRFLRPDGTVVWARVTITGVTGADGRPQRLVQVEDITARKEAEEHAARETQRLRTMISVQREVAAAAADRQATLQLVADRAVEALPAAEGALVGLVDGTELYAGAAAGTLTAHSDVRVQISGSLAGRVVTTGTTLRCDDIATDERVDRDNSLAAAVRSMVVAPLFADGRVFGTLGVSSPRAHAFDDADTEQLTLLADALSGALRHADDTEQRSRLLRQLQERADLLDLTQDAVIVRDLDGRVVYWNPAAEHIYGWAPEVAAGHDLDRLLGTVWTADLNRARIDRALHEHGTWAGELEHRRADGRRVTVLSRKSLQRDPDGNPVGILSINTDVTARRHAEQALRDSEQLFRSQFAHSAIGQVIRGADDRVQEVNPAFAAMLGYRPDQLIGDTIGRHISPEALPARARALATLFTGQADSYHQVCRLIRADGERLDVDVTVSVIRDGTGHPERFVCLFQDISDRRAAEAARDRAIAELAGHNRQLQEANRLKQDLMGMLGHEIGNPLTSILGYTEIFTEEWGELSAGRQQTMLNAISRNAHLIDGIVREVLTLVTLDAGQITATPEAVTVRDHLDAAVENTGTGGVTIDCPDGTVASVQPGHLAQILTNLLSNARKYGGGATAMTVTGDAATVRIAVHDAGPGVPPDLRPHLFDRFTRAQETAGTVKGTGLGLHIVRELARANGGDVHYEPAPERGSIFVLALPLPPAG